MKHVNIASTTSTPELDVLNSLSLDDKGFEHEKKGDLEQIAKDIEIFEAMNKNFVADSPVSCNHFAVFRSLEMANFYAEKASELKFSINQIASNEDNTIFQMVLMIDTKLNQVVLSTQSIFLRRLAMDFSGEYQGWNGTPDQNPCTADELKRYLATCGGSPTRYRHKRNTKLIYSEGVKGFFDIVKSSHILDVMAEVFAPEYQDYCEKNGADIAIINLTIYPETERKEVDGMLISGRLVIFYQDGSEFKKSMNIAKTIVPLGKWVFNIGTDDRGEDGLITTIFLPQEN